MDGALGWLKRVAPVIIKREEEEKNWSQEVELLELVKKAKDSTYTPCNLEPFTLVKILTFIAQFMASGKMNNAANVAATVSSNCFDEGNPENPKDPMNPYRLLFQSFAIIADCETRFYGLKLHKLNDKDKSLKVLYSLCQQTSSGILEMEPTVFKIPQLLNMCEEFARFACFRQCHVNILNNLTNINPDESVDWLDIVKVLDSNILTLINECDIGARLCVTDEEKKEFQMNLQQIEDDNYEGTDQYVFSWFNELHLREICIRAQAAMDVLKLDPAYIKFCGKHEFLLAESKKRAQLKEAPKNSRRRLPQNPLLEAEEKAKRISLGDDSGVEADANMGTTISNSKALERNDNSDQENNGTPILEDSKSFSDWNAERIREKDRLRKERAKLFQACGADKVLPEEVRRKVRMILRKLVARGREIQSDEVQDDEIMNLAFPVSDDDCSDDETVSKLFNRNENQEGLRRKKLRKFGLLSRNSRTKRILWYQYSEDELLTLRAIENHCVKMNGESTQPFTTMEKYLGESDGSGNFRNRMSELSRTAECRVFDIQTEIATDDGALLTMPSDPFKDSNFPAREAPQSIGIDSLFLQNLRRRCVDELMILLMIIKGQQQLQDGNVIRCLAYLMILRLKLKMFKGKISTEETRKTNFYSFLMHIYKILIDKYRLYATDTLGCNCLPDELHELMKNEGKSIDSREKCLKFCTSTQPYYFAICVRGRRVPFPFEKSEDVYGAVNYPRVCEQLEHFFSLDHVNKNNHMSVFFRTECMPILTGLVYLHNAKLLDSINDMSREDAVAELCTLKGLSKITKGWIRDNTGFGITKDLTMTDDKNDVKTSQEEESGKQYIVPFLFQMPFHFYTCQMSEKTVPKKTEDLRPVISDFVQEKYNAWKERCKADKENFHKVNRDRGYDEKRDLTFFGESIEKDVYMVAAYVKKPDAEKSEEIVSEMNSLCRGLRSQFGFEMLRKFNVEED